MKWVFLIKGSAALPYQVAFSDIGGQIVASCTCPAGTKGIQCKHRTGLMNGSMAGVVSGTEQDLSQLRSRLSGGGILRAQTELVAAERALAEAEQRLSKARRALSDAMQGRA